MADRDKPRVQFVKWTGGLNTQDEPWLLADSEYSTGENIELKTGVPQNRDGSAKFDGSNVPAAAIKGLGEYLFYDNDGVLTRYVLAVSGEDLHIWKNDGSWSYEGTSSLGVTSGYWATVTNFKNKALITNGQDAPLVYDADQSEATAFTLGIKAPNRVALISDFPATSSSDDDRVVGPYDYSGDDGTFPTEIGVVQWEKRIDGVDLVGNTTSLKLSETAQAGTQEETITFDDPIDLTQFTDDHASDDYDCICVVAEVAGWSYLDTLTISFDFSNGAFDTEWCDYVISNDTLDNMDWGGYRGGTYNIRLPKYTFLAFQQNVGTTWDIDWSTVKAIKFSVTKITESADTSNDATVYFDYLRLEESPPIPTPTKRLIDAMDHNDDWVKCDTCPDVSSSTAQKSYGLTSKKVTADGAWMGMTRNYSTPLDLAHWDNNVPVKSTDCIAWDVHVSSDSDMTYAIVTIRLWSGSRRVGLSKVFGTWVSRAQRRQAGIFTNNMWNEVKIPLSWIRDVEVWDTDKHISEWFDSNHPLFGDPDTDLDGWEPSEVLSKVTDIDLGMVFVNGGTNDTIIYFDNLRLETMPAAKMLASFCAEKVEVDIPVAEIGQKAIKVMTSGYPLIGNFLATAAEVVLPANIHRDFVIGEPWSVQGCENWEFDHTTKVSFFSSLRMEVAPGQIATATLNWSNYLSNPRNLAEFGGDSGAERAFYSIGGIEYDGIISDDVDVIELMVRTDRISSIELAQVSFSCDATNYFAYDVWAAPLGYDRDKADNKSAKKGYRSSGTSDLIAYTASPVASYGYDRARGALDPDSDEVRQDSTGLSPGMVRPINNVWYKLKMRKADFVFYGDDSTKGWDEITSVTFAFMANKENGMTIWLDRLTMRNEGALEGDYYYKTVFRTKDAQSAPTRTSPVAHAKGADVILASIPISSDARVIYKDIYRMGGDSSEFRYVDTIDNDDETYYDNRQDIELGEAIDEDYQEPPTARYGTIHNNRYFLARSKFKPSRLFWSRPFMPGAFPYYNYIDLDPSSYGEITGIITNESQLIVFKDNAVYTIMEGQQDGKSIYWWDMLDNTIGCDSPRSIFTRNSVVYWIWNNKPYRLIGNRVDTKFGEKAEDLFAYADSDACGCYHDGKALFSIKGATGSTENDVIISFNLRENCWESKNFGTGWNVNNMVSNYDNELIAGSAKSSYYLWQLFTGLTDDSAAIAAKVITRYVTGLEKRLEGRDLWTWCTKAGADDSMLITPIVDYEAKTADTFALADQTNPQVFKMGVADADVGGFLGYQFSCSTDTGRWKLLLAILEALTETDIV